MKDEGLNCSYDRLRRELDDAYAAPQWDSRRIDMITERMAPLERALASLAQNPARQRESARE